MTLKGLLETLISKGILLPNQTINDFDIENKQHKKFYLENADLIFQSKSHNNEQAKIDSLNKPNKIHIIVSSNNEKQYFFKGRQLTPLSKSINKVFKNGELVEDFSMLLCDFWEDINFNNTQNQGGVGFPAGKKPEELLYRMIDMITSENDLVLDFFVGSGSTAAVAHKMNRRYIGIEQMEYIETLPNNRLVNVIQGEQGGISKSVNWKGGGSFVYMELAQANQHFVEQIEAADTEGVLLEIWERMKTEAFISYKVTADMIDKNIKEYEALSFDNKKRFLIETLDKNLLYVPHCDMESKEFGLNEADKAATKVFYKLKNEA
ncbi:MAG: site-specific DNA-methyltransferase [Saprospiraceae bacterium]|nr:site-specific DNA-methyltransferase [Saprospiraceae bacterium]